MRNHFCVYLDIDDRRDKYSKTDWWYLHIFIGLLALKILLKDAPGGNFETSVNNLHDYAHKMNQFI